MEGSARGFAEPRDGCGHDHRHRRSGRFGQGHAGQAHRRALRPALSRYRPALSRRGPRRAQARPGAGRCRGRRGAARPRSGEPRRSAICAATGSAKPPPSVGAHPARYATRCWPSSTILPASRRARCSTGATSAPWSARTPTLRFSSPPARSARRTAVSGAQARGERHTYETVLARNPPPGRAGRGVPSPDATGHRRLLAGYQQFGYRSRIRYRCRRDLEEGWPARAHLKVHRNPSWRSLRRRRSDLHGHELGLRPTPSAYARSVGNRAAAGTTALKEHR